MTGDLAEGVREEAVGGGPVVHREAFHGDQGVDGVQEAGETGLETTVDDMDDLYLTSKEDSCLCLQNVLQGSYDIPDSCWGNQ